MSPALRSREAETLLALVDVALDQARPADFLERQARSLRSRRMRAACADASRGLRAGLPPSQALRSLPRAARAALAAGERRGDARSGLAQALDALALGTRARSLVLAPTLQPALALTLSLLVVGACAKIAAPPIASLGEELGFEPSPTLRMLAVHGSAVLGIAGALATAAGLLPVIAGLGARTAAGSALLLRIPIVGSLLENHAIAQHAGALAPLLAAGEPADRALADAAAAVETASMRRRFEAAAARAGGGDDLARALEASGVGALAARLRLDASARDGGAAALGLARDEAVLSCEAAARRLGRIAATAAILATGALALLLVHALVLSACTWIGQA